MNAEMLNPNLYTGGLRNKEARDAWMSKNHLEKWGKKLQGPEHGCISIVYVYGNVCVRVYNTQNNRAIHRNKRHRGLKTETTAGPSVPASWTKPLIKLSQFKCCLYMFPEINQWRVEIMYFSQIFKHDFTALKISISIL